MTILRSFEIASGNIFLFGRYQTDRFQQLKTANAADLLDFRSFQLMGTMVEMTALKVALHGISQLPGVSFVFFSLFGGTGNFSAAEKVSSFSRETVLLPWNSRRIRQWISAAAFVSPDELERTFFRGRKK